MRVEAIVCTMKIVDTMSNQAKANHPKRRFYSAELKAEVVQQCTQGGASVARVALHHGINANIVHRWLREDENAALTARTQSFIPVTFDTPGAAALANDGASGSTRDIRVEVRRGSSAITVNWPLAGAASCGAWLREWLG